MVSKVLRYLLQRLLRQENRRLVGRALEQGILQGRTITIDGHTVSAFELPTGFDPETVGQLTTAFKGPASAAREVGPPTLETMCAQLNEEWDEEEDANSSPCIKRDPWYRASNPLSDRASLRVGAKFQREIRSEPTCTAAEFIRGLARRPEAAEVVTCLLLAAAVEEVQGGLAQILEVLKEPQPFINFHAPVEGVEDVLIDLLEFGIVIPGSTYAMIDGFKITRRGTWPEPVNEVANREMIVFQGSKWGSQKADHLPWKLANAVKSRLPILGVASKPDPLPDWIRIAAKVNLTAPAISMAIIRSTMRVVLGEEPSGEIPKDLCELLTLFDMSTAIRTGNTADQALEKLHRFAIARTEFIAEDDEPDLHPVFGRRMSKGLGKRRSHEVIEPRAVGNPQGLVTVPTVETLPGFDEARAWTENLLFGLEEWKNGSMQWSELASKALLFGPPGTGKTTFAKALCNSAQIPLVATSVAAWAGAGSLDDLIRDMEASFEEARRLQPSILFIDEIDGLGTRQESGHSSGYWTSVVNRMLELLQGVSDLPGVVVLAATNRVEAVDKAIIRAGRLETHLEVRLPDIGTLSDILRFHLGSDLDHVVATRPIAPPEISSQTGQHGRSQ
ncbi:AAA family ATPase [Phyllobacterium sp. SYP-B3895]|uniref:AAA family ATPase n=1 Tax=Phyllobacterium sp. SYP-B3895 TaxID=2663240 RepID=UPI001299997C|nr:AAA family ATPase [Phyllobacterium sp. SYP-B3895]MRG57437.1 AAA family ATPase [Phyllobacterium sp. SYP-B3895]